MDFRLETSFLQETIRNFNGFKAFIMNQKTAKSKPLGCEQTLMAIKDTMELLSGKWKIQIVGSLMMNGTMRFMDLLRDVDGIAAKMLSKELQDLEVNELVSRTVKDTKPVTVEYTLTEHGRSLENLINEVAKWGILHRNRLFQTNLEAVNMSFDKAKSEAV